MPQQDPKPYKGNKMFQLAELTLKQCSVANNLAIDARETALLALLSNAFAASLTIKRDVTNDVAISANLN